MTWDDPGGGRGGRAPRGLLIIAGIADIALDRKSKTAQLHAKLGWVGMTLVKSLGILVEGEGYPWDRVIR
jgi:hypothetical protein